VRVLILDDETSGRRDLRKLLEHEPDIEAIDEARDVAAAIGLTETSKPDVAFLDVRLRGETSFDYVGRLSGQEPRLVFITGYDEYAVRAFECNALDYLLKPIEPARLAETLNRIRLDVRLRRDAAGPDDAVFLRFEQTARLVPWSEISHIESRGNYTQVFTQDEASIMILRPLKEWAELVPPKMFVRTHRTTMVRIQAIRSVDFASNRQRCLVLESGASVPVSRFYWPEVKAALVAWHPTADSCLR